MTEEVYGRYSTQYIDAQESRLADLDILITQGQFPQLETSEAKRLVYMELLRAFFAQHNSAQVVSVERIVNNLSWECINRWCFQRYGDTPAAPNVESRDPVAPTQQPIQEQVQVFTIQRAIPGPPLAVPWQGGKADERALIDEWILAKKLNKYGDPLNSAYDFEIPNKYAYVRKRHPTHPWRPTRTVVVTCAGAGGTNSSLASGNTVQLFAKLVWPDGANLEQLFLDNEYKVVMCESGAEATVEGARVDYWNLQVEHQEGLWAYCCGGVCCWCCWVGLLALLLFLLGFTFHSHAGLCANGVMDDFETGIDCGGQCGGGCSRGLPCKVSGDCESPFVCEREADSGLVYGICAEQKKAAAVAGSAPAPGPAAQCVLDGVLSSGSTETGADCGGACAAPHLGDARRRCGIGVGCAIDDDCESGHCENTKCAQ